MSLADKLGITAAGDKFSYSQHDMAEFAKCAEDPVYFASNYMTIVNLDKGKQKFHMYDYQKRVTRDIWEKHYYPDGSLRRHNLIMQARQSGKTITVAANLLHHALFNEDKTIAILANKERAAIEIMRRIKFAYQNLPKFLKVGIVPGGWNKKNIAFENGSRILAAATSSDGIRGESVNILFLDEFAFVRDEIAEEFIASVFPTILSGETTKIIVVSTPNPKSLNHFYYMVQEAEANVSGFYMSKVLWNETPGHDEAWKQRTIRELGSKRRWDSEYELLFFGQSMSTLVDAEALKKIVCREPLYFKYDEMMAIYEDPQEDTYYVMGVDTGQGIGKDYSIISVLKVNSKFDTELVAIYRNNKVDVYDFAKVCYEVAEWYTGAKMVVENNDRGRIVCEQLVWEHEFEHLVCNKEGELGVFADHKTKSESNALLKRYIESGWVKINDKNTLTELSKYVQKKPDVFAADGKRDHDDCVAGLRWAIFLFSLPDFREEDIAFVRTGKYSNGGSADAAPFFCDDSSSENLDESYDAIASRDPRMDVRKEVNGDLTSYTSDVIQNYPTMAHNENSMFGRPQSMDCGLSR